MKRRAFLGLGGTFIGVGGLFSTGAFSSVSAGRGVSVRAVSDPDALLGIKGTGLENTLSVTNNFSSGISVELDADETGIKYEIDGVIYEDPETITLNSGGMQEVFFESSGGNESVTIDFTATSDNGQAMVTLQRTVQIPQAELLDLTANVKSAGQNGFFEFEVKNSGGIDVTIKKVAINDATTVNNTDYDPFKVNTELTDMDNDNYAPPEQDGIPINDEYNEFFRFKNDITLSTEGTNKFKTNKLIEKNKPGNSDNLQESNADYTDGGTLDVSLKLGDGSVAVLEMEV